ncbi:lysophospholipase L1-like esterase [Agromyces hippuratus]|uniref:Lysophospholipase L1-like esterase n=1 Tax=Agromyces hippuratus TaxID=286438 RepID=A0A852WSV6_9MICO|nr:SGNH/GDSL hydrolase family protein [Agromyces hippuratus]NYG20638.1 lysophospholipase L1-like esterase [Agromyces hippuratus]
MTAVLPWKGRVTGIAAAAIIALVAIPAGIAGPASAAPPSSASSSPVAKYVALGDSVAAGQGAGGYVDACLRSPAGYPTLLDAAPRTNLLRNPSCSGATIADVAANQLSQLNRGTTLVTLTVGANEVDLPGILAACATPEPSLECLLAVQAAQDYLASGQLTVGIAGLVTAIATRSPGAEVLVTGYAIPFQPGLLPLTDQVNALAGAMNSLIRAGVAGAAASGIDAGYVDVTALFAGHGVGSGASWLGENPADPITFLHPNAAGYSAYRDALLTASALP